MIPPYQNWGFRTLIRTAVRRPLQFRQSRRSQEQCSSQQGSRRRGRIVAARLAVALAVAEINVVGNHFRAAAVVAILVFPVADLKPALDHGHAALGEVLADELCGLAPSDYVDEIGGLLAALAALEVAVDRDGEGRHRRAVLRAAQLGITGESTHDDDTVQHSAALLTRPCRRSWSG